MAMKYCPNCKQNVVPRAETKWGMGCLLFLVCLVVGVIFMPFIVLFWGAGLLILLLSGAAGYRCPICKLPKRRMRRAVRI